ncbi:hypothetical protein KC952_02835 [Candidatus Saccharibacteria bacterium]|nr:hypothetical protein [Candidatus Saccharibacteria bacterium]
MVKLKEIHFNPDFAVDEDGDVKPIADYYPEFEPDGSSNEGDDPIIVGPYMTLKSYYEAELRLIKLASEIAKLRGFGRVALTSQSIQKRYGNRTPEVIAGANNKLKKIIHETLPEIYMAEQLIAAGFDKDDVKFGVLTEFRLELEAKYGGKENTKKRALRREQIREILKRLER